MRSSVSPCVTRIYGCRSSAPAGAEPALRRYIEQRGAGELVELCGWLSADERDALLASSVAMLLPSVREGWGLAVIEAALQGTPTVAYRTAGGVAESIHDGVTGLLVDTPDELERAAGVLLDQPELRERLSGACRDWALSFDWDQAADEVERLLLRVGADAQVAGEP